MRIRISIFKQLLCIALFSNVACKQKESTSSNKLVEQFLNKPISAKTFVRWHWMGFNFSKEGITKDLKTMKATGIGDEQKPADFEWGKDRGEKMGRAMLAYPDWFIKNEPRPSQGRKTFSVWYYYRKDSPLKPAGLVGPVRLVAETEVKL